MLSPTLTPEQAHHLPGDRQEPADGKILVSNDTKYAVVLSIEKWWQLLCVLCGLVLAVWGFHSQAMASIDSKVEKAMGVTAEKVEATRQEREKYYVTEAQARRMLDEYSQRLEGKVEGVRGEVREMRKEIIDLLKSR